MNEIGETEKNFYLEIKHSIDTYADLLVGGLSEDDVDTGYMSEKEKEAFAVLKEKNFSVEELQAIKLLFKEGSFGVVHSLFVSIDGGTAISNEGKALELVHQKTGVPLTTAALHENFFEVALDD